MTLVIKVFAYIFMWEDTKRPIRDLWHIVYLWEKGEGKIISEGSHVSIELNVYELWYIIYIYVYIIL